MKVTYLGIVLILFSLVSLLALAGCKTAQGSPQEEAPPAAHVVSGLDLSLFTVEHPEQFPLVTAVEHTTVSELVVTGAVAPDIARNVPVISLASGRVMGIHARLGDTVRKGQLLLTIRSDDVSGGYSNYRKAIADEVLARHQLDRAKDLFEHGGISQNDLQVAEDVEDKAKVDIETMSEHLRLLGNDPGKPQGMVDIVAPTSGVITDQQVTDGAAVQAFNTPSPFTISDLSSVWVICDVYENDLAAVKLGDWADITLNAYPDRKFKGRVSNIGAILDPSIRTAKVRIEVRNPGIMRIGMFVKAAFHGQSKETRTVVPASAIMHMHDRDWVFIPAPGQKFRRLEVTSGELLPENMQEVNSGIQPGQQVVVNALIFDHALVQ